MCEGPGARKASVGLSNGKILDLKLSENKRKWQEVSLDS